MSYSSVTSEALQLKLRQLLPSQQGFGTDLSASDTIIPIIDLTAAAEGSDTSLTLQEAFSFADITSVQAENNTQVIANTAGFWRLAVSASIRTVSGTDVQCTITMTDGATTKTLWSVRVDPSTEQTYAHPQRTFTVFLNSGESISAVSNAGNAFTRVSARQIADVNGTLKNPAGFTPQ